MTYQPEFSCESFADLTPHELYAILQLRIAVFMVEQRCFFTETDGYDPQVLHLYAYHDDKQQIGAYARLFSPYHDYHGAVCPMARIGRVAIHGDYRGQGMGRIIMDASLAEIKKRFGDVAVTLSAQAHLQDFYVKNGFVAQGEPYEEDGVPHIEMIRPAQAAS